MHAFLPGFGLFPRTLFISRTCTPMDTLYFVGTGSTVFPHSRLLTTSSTYMPLDLLAGHVQTI